MSNKEKDMENLKETNEEEIILTKKGKKEISESSTLEKNPANLEIVKYDLEFDIDPLFQKTSAKFDESGAKGLLLQNLNVI